LGFSFLQYDVFTGEPLLGNQLAVFTDARGLDADRMQRIAREMNFSESTFILPAESATTPTSACGSSRRTSRCRWQDIRR
jgi:PhzF family phenazine biosynthesis protein